MALPRFTKNLCAVFREDFFRAVIHLFIEDSNDFSRPIGDTFKCAANATRFVAGDDTNGNRQFLFGGYGVDSIFKLA